MQKLSVKEKMGYGVGEIASNLIWQTLMFFLPIFYTDTFGIPAAAVGTMLLIVRIFDGVNDPVMGMIADRTNTRWGKYRPYILWMAIPYGIGGVLMFITPNTGYIGKLIYAYATYIFMMIIYTAMMIPFSALSGVMTSGYLERTSLNSYRFVGAFVGGLFIQGLALYMVAQLGDDNESVVNISINGQQIVVNESGPGTAKVLITAQDVEDHEISDEFLIKVYRPGENPPYVHEPIRDTVVEQGFGKLSLNFVNLFRDDDNDKLEYEVRTSKGGAIDAENEDCILEIKEKGVGTTVVTLIADDKKGGVATHDLVVRVNEAGNNFPAAVRELADVEYKEVFKKKSIDIAKTLGYHKESEVDIKGLFADPDDDELFIVASSNNPAVATANVVGDKLIVKKKAPGKAVITLKADDHRGGLAEAGFNVSIQTEGNVPPVVTRGIDDLSLQQGFGQRNIDISQVFQDYNGDKLTYKMEITNSAKGYRYTMTIFGLMCVVLFLVTFVTTRERIKPLSKEKSKVLDDLRDLVSNRPWVILFIVSLITLIYVAIRSAVIAYYLQYYVGDSTLTGAFLVISSVTIILVLPLTKWLTRIFDKRMLFVICMLIVAGSLALYNTLGPEDILLMFVLQILQSVGSAPTMPLLWSMLADSADYSEWKTGRKAMGLSYSAATLAQKVGFGVGGAIALWLLAWFGYQPNMLQSESSLLGMKMMMGVIPAIGALLCAVIVWFYSLDSKKMKLIEADLKERRLKAGLPDLEE